jgi:hypothetical protein
MFSNLRRCISNAEHDQPVTNNHIREFPEPNPNRIPGWVRPARPRETAKTEFLGSRRTPRAREWLAVARFAAAWGSGCRGRNGPGGGECGDLGWRTGPGPGDLGTAAEARLLSRFQATRVPLKTEILKTSNDSSREGGGRISVFQISRSSDI